MEKWRTVYYGALLTTTLWSCSIDGEGLSFETGEDAAEADNQEGSLETNEEGTYIPVRNEEILLPPEFEQEISGSSQVLEYIEGLVASEELIVIDNDLTLTYSGMWYEENEQFYGVFLLTNKTGMTLNEMTFGIDWMYEGEVILDEYPVHYSADEMTSLPNDATLVWLVPVEEDAAHIVENMGEGDMHLSVNEIELIDYEE